MFVCCGGFVFRSRWNVLNRWRESRACWFWKDSATGKRLCTDKIVKRWRDNGERGLETKMKS